ncbi:MAG: hypothetical protein IJF17_09290 [Thermoguttaceae bacterium]|nr:hypothetical protein [Thermoguttaceae bacterium]
MSEFENIREKISFFFLGSALCLAFSQILWAQNYSASTYRPSPTAYVPVEDESFTWSSLNSLTNETPQAATPADLSAVSNSADFQNSSRNSAETEDLTIGEMLEAQSANHAEPNVSPNVMNVSWSGNKSINTANAVNPAAANPASHANGYPSTHSESNSYSENINLSNRKNSGTSFHSTIANNSQNTPSAAQQIQLAGYDVPSKTSSESANTAISPMNNSKAPAPLPPDYPTGEMAPLDPQNLIAFSEMVSHSGAQFQQITIIDPAQKVLCVYQINTMNGQIELKSARKIEWDLQLIYLNSQKPLPQDVQAILKQNQRKR